MTYLPARFRCMQLGILWQPDLTGPSVVNGRREQAIFDCQRRCQDTPACEHFTVLFPNTCHLAGAEAKPLPSGGSAMSGPAWQNCDSHPNVSAPWAATFMKA